MIAHPPVLFPSLSSPCSYSDEDLLLPLLDVSAAKLGEFQPRAVVELVRLGLGGLPEG